MVENKTVVIDNIFLGLLLFIPITLLATYVKASPRAIFFLSGLAIIPLARYIGEATEELSVHVG